LNELLDGGSVSSLYSPSSSQFPVFDASERIDVRKSSVNDESYNDVVGSSIVDSSCV
jgi:hypothetical protein